MMDHHLGMPPPAMAGPQHPGSPIELDMWDLQLKGENYNFIPVRNSGMAPHQQAPQRSVDAAALDCLHGYLSQGTKIKELKEEIARLVMQRAMEAGGAFPSASRASPQLRSEEAVNKVLEMVALPLGTRLKSPTPVDAGRQTIDRELQWADLRSVPLGVDTTRPNAPINDTPVPRHWTRSTMESKLPLPRRPKPTVHRTTRPVSAKQMIKSTLKRSSKSTVTRSASSAFSDCRSSDFGSFTSSSVSQPHRTEIS